MECKSISYKFRYIKIMYIYEKMCLNYKVTWLGICGSKICIKVTIDYAKRLSTEYH